MLSINVVKRLKRKCWKQSQSIMCIFEYLMYIFLDQMCTFGYLKIPDIILSLSLSQKLDWTHTFGTYYIKLSMKNRKSCLKPSYFTLNIFQDFVFGSFHVKSSERCNPPIWIWLFFAIGRHM